jgi:hypothetical protein
VLVGHQHEMPGRDLENALIQRSQLRRAEREVVVDRLFVPPCRHSGGKQRLDLRGQVERVVMPGVEQRLDSEAIARGEEPAAVFVPQQQRKLTAQVLQAVHAEVLV